MEIQTYKRFKRTLFIRTKTQSANFGGIPLYQATKRHLTRVLGESPLSSYKTTLKQQLNGEKGFYVFRSCFRTLAVILVSDLCWCVEISDCWAEAVHLYVFRSCFRTLAVILVSDFCWCVEISDWASAGLKLYISV